MTSSASSRDADSQHQSTRRGRSRSWFQTRWRVRKPGGGHCSKRAARSAAGAWSINSLLYTSLLVLGVSLRRGRTLTPARRSPRRRILMQFPPVLDLRPSTPFSSQCRLIKFSGSTTERALPHSPRTINGWIAMNRPDRAADYYAINSLDLYMFVWRDYIHIRQLS